MLATAISASERGAMDFLPKPFDIDELLSTVKNAFRKEYRGRTRQHRDARRA